MIVVQSTTALGNVCKAGKGRETKIKSENKDKDACWRAKYRGGRGRVLICFALQFNYAKQRIDSSKLSKFSAFNVRI